MRLMKRNPHIGLIVMMTLGAILSPPCFGKIVIKGSDTLGAKLVPQLAESFRSSNISHLDDRTIEIAAEGSATGIASLIDGTADIAMLSRDLSPEELLEAKGRGIELKAIEIARDALVVITHRSNPVEDLTLQEVREIFTGDIQNWAAITHLPEPVSAYSRNTSSGTYVAFQRLALQSRNYSRRIQKMASNEQISHEVAGSLGGIGYVGLAYAKNSGTRVLRINERLPVDSGYPLARPLYFLVNSNLPQSSLSRAFIDYALSDEGQELVASLDFLPAR